jgi:hypothetical protein
VTNVNLDIQLFANVREVQKTFYAVEMDMSGRQKRISIKPILVPFLVKSDTVLAMENAAFHISLNRAVLKAAFGEVRRPVPTGRICWRLLNPKLELAVLSFRVFVKELPNLPGCVCPL